jgi:hypothetical protein
MNTNGSSETLTAAFASRTCRLLTIGLLGCGLAAHAVPPPTGIAPVTVPTGGFAIDGKLIASGGIGDWLAGTGGAGVLNNSGAPLNSGTTFHFIDPYNSGSDKIFAGGAKWDDDPNTWQWTTGKPTAKNDMNNVLLHVTTDTNLHTWLVIAADRLSTSGDSYIDFEFLQNSLVRNKNGGFTSAGPDGGRTVNDLILSLAFTGGGSTADFLAYRWLATGSGTFGYIDSTSALPSGRVFVAANSANESVPFGAFGQTSYAPNAFAEAAIDLTALMQDFDPCLSIGIKTIMIKTKSSQADPASTTDFIDPIQFALKLGPQVSAGANQTQCSGASATDFALQGTATPGDLPISSTAWSVISGTALIDDPASLNTTAHVSSSSATLRLSVVQVNGCVKSSDVVLTVASRPTCSISGPSTVCPGSIAHFSAPAGMSFYAWSISGSASISGPSDHAGVNLNAAALCGSDFTLTLTVTSNGCSSTCSTTVGVIDLVPPTVTAPPDVVLECPDDTRPASTGTASAQDDCGQATVSFSDVVTSGCGGTKTIIRTWTAIDGCGNTATAVQNITVRDTTPPVITAPVDLTLECPADTDPSSTGTATAQDGCSTVTVTFQDATVNNCGGTKVITRTWTATDACGNSANAVQKITVVDTTPPTIVGPADVVVPFTSDISPATTGQATATDGCGSATVSFSDAFSTQNDGSQVITRTWVATDACGNRASASQTITLDSPSALILPVQTDILLTNLTTLTVINTATNPNVPANAITYQLIDPPAGMSIDGNGIITWTPTLGQSPSTNVITTVVTTTVTSAVGTTTLSSTNTFVVAITTPYDGLDMGVDTDGDGLTNLVEFAVGSDPKDSADANSGISIWITEDSGNRYLAMRFNRRVNASALQLQYVPEVSADKAAWYADSANVLQLSVTPLNSDFDTVIVRDQTPILATAARFIRLHIISASLESASPTWIGTSQTVQGNGGTGTKFTTFSQRMVLPVLYAGTVSTVQGAALTDANASWGNSQFTSSAYPTYAEFDNGWMVDITDTTASTKSLSLAGSVSGLVSPGDVYRVREHFTIASLFGTNNETGLKAGLNPASADNIVLIIPETQQTMTIFYFSNEVAQGWYRADFTPAANQVVYPQEGVMVRRVAAEDVNVYLCGPIKTGVTMAPVEPGFNLVGTLKSLNPMTLDSLNLYTGDSSTGVASGLNLAASDNILVVQPDGSTSSYFYFKDTKGNALWLNALFNPAGSTPIPAGSAFFIKRLPNQAAFNWLIPAE